MTQPGFRTDTDALRWYGTQCSAIAEDIGETRRTVFDSAARIDDSAWGGRIMYLTGLRSSLDRLRTTYEQARAATAARLDEIASQLEVTDMNLGGVANAYDAADAAARRRMPR